MNAAVRVLSELPDSVGNVVIPIYDLEGVPIDPKDAIGTTMRSPDQTHP